MCFSFEASIISYVLGITASTLLLQSKNNTNKHIALFCLTFVHIQLAEAFMWSDINCKNNLNHYGSILAHFNLILQPLSILIGAYYLNTTIIPKNILQVLIIVYCVPLLMVIYHYNFKKPFKLSSLNTSKNKGELMWDFNMDRNNLTWKVYSFFYLICLFFTWLFLKDKLKGNLMFILLIITIILSVVYTKSIKLDEFLSDWESKWCFYSVGIPVIFLFMK
jgi:hypothetical protein